jgi:hypothetical protein
MSDDDPLTPRTRAGRYVSVQVRCRACRHSADADLDALIRDGRGDVPLVRLRFRCGNKPWRRN